MITVLCLVLACYFGIIRFNTDNIENNSNDYKNEVISANPSQTYVLDTYVNNVKIDGTIADPSEPVRLICKDAEGKETEIFGHVEIKNQDTYIRVGAQVSSLTFALKEGDSIKELEINPTKINVNFAITMFLFLFPVVIAWAIINTVEDRVAFKKDILAMKRYKWLLYDLVTRDIKTKYRRSALGVLWSVLNPLLMMLVLTAVFSQIIKVPVEGGFALFYLTGYIIFNFISESSNFSLTSILFAGGLIKKVYIPKYVFPLEKTIFSFVNMLFSLIAFVLVFVIFLITGQVQLHATMLLFFVPMIYVFVFSFGLNLILATLNVFFRDVGHLWGVFITVWMYATPIIYPINLVPSWLQTIIKCNPLYHYVTYFRNVMIYGTLPTLEDNIICIAFSLMFLALGVVIFRKNQDKFILHI